MRLIPGNILFHFKRIPLLPVFLTLLFLFPVNLLRAQDLDQKISLKAKNQPISEVLDRISREYGILFSYSSQRVPVTKTVTIRAENKSIREVLNDLLLQNGIAWSVQENQIILTPATESTEPASQASTGPGKRYTISGYVRDKTNGEALIGANILALQGETGATTNSYGFYSITLPSGIYSIRCSYLGFAEGARELSLQGDSELLFELEETAMGIREVVVTAADQEALPGNDQVADFSFSGRTLSRLPGFAGDVDLLKALQTLPGIRSFGDGSALFYVRGGNHDQNLMLIDEAPIYNPSHLFGFFSVLSPDAINEIQVYKGDFPAKYGGRASSVIDITAREGNLKRFGLAGNLGPYASSLSVEGPVVRDKASFFVSGRLSTLNWLNYVTDDPATFNLYFYDINAKLNWKPGKRDRLFLTFYTGQDVFNRYTNSVYRTYGISWNNLAGTLRWNHLFGRKLFSTTTLNYSHYTYYLYLSQNHKDYWESAIVNLTLKSDFSWYLNDWNTLRSGFSITQYRIDPGNVTQQGSENQVDHREVAKYRSMEYVLYLSNENTFRDLVTLEYGIRLPLWQDLGPTTVYYFDANHQVIDTLNVPADSTYDLFFNPEPRVSLGMKIRDWGSVKVSYSRTTQCLQQLSDATGPFTTQDVWAPAGPNIPPLKVDQITAGFYLKFAASRLYGSVEVFGKEFHNYLDYADHPDLLYNPLLEGQLRFGKARSAGVELMLRKPAGKLTGWAGYTWSFVSVETPEVNNGQKYPASFDSPNNICLFLSYDTWKRWAFSASWIYMTGNPVTAPTGFYTYNGYTVPVYGARNNARLPDYYRLDLSVLYRLNKPGSRFRHSVVVTVYNAYGRANPFSVSFNKFKDAQGNFVVPSNLDGSYNLVPTMISVARIIPSINYQFKF
ncbi:MAG: TonB-dependent receptor [bacterium]